MRSRRRAVVPVANAAEASLAAGIEVYALSDRRGETFALFPLLQHLACHHHALNVLVEAGPGLMGSLVASFG